MKTRDEVEALKAGWMKDPCWDIETTEGFEEHQAELIEFRNKTEARWQSEIEERMDARRRVVKMETSLSAHDHFEHISTFREIEAELKSLDSQIGDGGSATGWAQFVIAREQVRATLLQAAQVQRVGDLLEELSDEPGSDIDFSTKLYKVE